MAEPIYEVSTISAAAAPTQPIVINLQQPPSSGGIGGFVIYLIMWLVWAYVWCLFAATSIFFIRSDYDIIATIEHSILLAVYPIIEFFALLYRECIVPCYCLADAVYYDVIDKLTFWSSNKHETPAKCGGKSSAYCQSHPQPGFMSEAWFLCGHGTPPVGGQCTVPCNYSNQPGAALAKSD